MENYTCFDVIDNLLVKNTERLNQLLNELKTKSNPKIDETTRENICGSIEKLLDEFPNREDVISECVLNWMSTNNISCLKYPLRSDILDANHPLSDLISKTSAAMKLEEWKRICFKFESSWKKTLRELLSIPTENETKDTKNISKRSCLYLIKYYCFLFESKDVWKLYKQIRQEEFLKYLNVKSQIDVTKDSCLRISKDISDKLLELITEDARICYEIGSINLNNEDVVEIYLDSLSDFFENLSKEINDVNSQSSNNVICDSVNSNWKEIVLLEEETEEYSSLSQKMDIQDVVNVVLMAGDIETNLQSFLRELNWMKNDLSEEKSKSSLKSKSSKTSVDSLKSNNLWVWRGLFVGYLSDLCQFVEERIRRVTSTSLQEEISQLKNDKELEYLTFCPARALCDPWIPRKVTLSIGLIGEIFQEMAILAKICDNELLSVRNAFLITSKQYSMDVINHIVRLSQESTQTQVNLHLLLSSAVYFKTILNGIHEQFKDNMPFTPEIKHLSELIDTLIQRIKFHNETLLSTGIFYDVESQNWKNNKPFYEDEKCSFSIEMWILHMKWLKFNLSTTCCSNHAYEILLQIFKFSISWLATRYSRVKPSFSRVNQFRRDVVSILLFSSEFICSFYHLNSPDLEIIHYHCNSLLIAAVVITSPLSTLHKVSKKGLEKWKNENWKMTSWMRVMRPVLWRYENEGDATASELGRKLKFICSQIAPHWKNIVELLISHECLLPLMMVCHVVEHSSEFDEMSSNPMYCGIFNCSRSALCVSDSVDVVGAVVTVLAFCGSMPNALSTLLIPVFKRFNQWNLFLFSNSLDNVELPSWILSVRNLLTPFCTERILPIVDKILNAPCTPWHKVVEITTKFSGSKPASDYRCDVTTAASELVDEFLKSLCLLSKPLLRLFDAIEKELIDSDKEKLTGGSVVVHVLGNHVYKLMMQRAEIFSIRKEERENLKAIGRQFIHILTTNEKVVVNIVGSEIDEISETFLSVVTWEIINNEKAFIALQEIYKVVKMNENWLVVSLDLDSGDVKFNTLLPLIKDETNLPVLDQVDCVKKLDKFPFDWRSLLECGMGMNEMTFRLLLHRRCEFEDGAQLTENEKKYVNHLINQYSFNI